MTEIVLELKHISKRFGDLVTNDDVSLPVPFGHVDVLSWTSHTLPPHPGLVPGSGSAASAAQGMAAFGCVADAGSAWR